MTGLKTIMKTVENAGYFSHIVFKGLLPYFRENLGLCGKGLIIIQDVQ